METGITKNQSNNQRLGTAVKWILVLGLLTFVVMKYRSLFEAALERIQDMPFGILAFCFFLGNLYFLADGRIVSLTTATSNHPLTIWQGIYTSYMCHFYRMATLGGGTGVAQLYYYSTKGIPVGEGTGMCLAQYTFQKITIGLYGAISFLLLLFLGNKELLNYGGYMLAGTCVISLISGLLFFVTVSKRVSNGLMKVARKLVRENSRYYDKLFDLQKSIDSLQTQGKLLWQERKLFWEIVFWNLIKFSGWYLIPGVLFTQNYSVNVFYCMALMAVCNMIGCVMIAPAGIGTLDFVFAIFFATLIAEPDARTAALIMYRFFTWILPFFFGILPAICVNSKKSTTV